MKYSMLLQVGDTNDDKILFIIMLSKIKFFDSIMYNVNRQVQISFFFLTKENNIYNLLFVIRI